MTQTYTRTGDAGETGLFGGARVPKNSLRVETYGTLDELNALLGVARAHSDDEEVAGIIHCIQMDLFTVSADLATPSDIQSKGRIAVPRMPTGWIDGLEKTIDRLEAELAPLRVFILPGGTLCSAYLHLARTVCRRAERRVLTLLEFEEANPCIPVYLNRLSDLLFVLARWANHRSQVEETPWQVNAASPQQSATFDSQKTTAVS
ncbi:MAG: cob(I)yrinic acid a,c-diamide adenosyltransferase [Chloroflexi bacterium]|nr:cob(I)yrinic acid a,c-diamide adenosyltransferase [Chloroflexota bacterium]